MKTARRARKPQQEEEEGHLDELHDQEQLTGRLVHLDQLDDAGVSDPSQHCHFIFYQMLLFTHRTVSESHLCLFQLENWWKVPAHLPTAASFVDDLQSVFLPRRPVNQISISNIPAVNVMVERTHFSYSFHAPHLSTHSLTTAKLPSPMTLPIWYFSLMRGEEMERLPFTARRLEA